MTEKELYMLLNPIQKLAIEHQKVYAGLIMVAILYSLIRGIHGPFTHRTDDFEALVLFASIMFLIISFIMVRPSEEQKRVFKNYVNSATFIDKYSMSDSYVKISSMHGEVPMYNLSKDDNHPIYLQGYDITSTGPLGITFTDNRGEKPKTIRSIISKDIELSNDHVRVNPKTQANYVYPAIVVKTISKSDNKKLLSMLQLILNKDYSKIGYVDLFVPKGSWTQVNTSNGLNWDSDY